MIVRKLPYYAEPTSVEVRGRPFPVKRDQIVLWISVSEKGLPDWDARIPKFPAILDPGCNHNLLINEQQLAEWAGIHPGYLPKRMNIRMAGQSISQLAANVWLHRNVPGHRDEHSVELPFELRLVPGIAVYPATEGEPVHPRLPLLGLRAFREDGLRIVIDCRRSLVNIYTPRRFWFFD